MAATTTASSVTMAIHQCSSAFPMATGARVRPMTAITGPVTTGGNSFLMKSLPTNVTMIDMIT